jgi:hypothetical protein
MLAANDAVTRSWAAVALFYTAHQLVHAVLDGEDNLVRELRHPRSHGSTSGGVLGTSELVARLYGADIDQAYKSLFGTSHAVRYNGEVVAEELWRDLLDTDFMRVAEWARGKLVGQGRTTDLDWL